jgi:hypothetical protein
LKTYHVRNKTGSYANAVNCSISFLGSANASEAKTGSWVYESTSKEACYVTSQAGGKECMAPTVGASYNKSIKVATKVKIPAAPTTSGTVLFKHHFRYQTLSACLKRVSTRAKSAALLSLKWCFRYGFEPTFIIV